ncbi:MAG TPA: phosphoglycerate dehydrogenase [Desulfosalsimonadaceae bacterium]|nr:phosphoglycerate dehydrogenase [Desulfosalsimonadaceae bacterium]
MKVLVSDNLGKAGIELLEEASGIEVDVKTNLSPEELQAIIKDYEALVVRSATKVTAELLEKAEKLKVVGRAGIGLDNVDVAAATKMGVVVMNTPDGNVVTTAEHTIALMTSLSRNVAQGTASLKAGLWEKKKLQGRELMNKTLGVLGFGKIGSVVADRARGLKMQVMVYDPVVQPDTIRKKGFEPGSVDEIYQNADYITVHVPKSKNTEKMISHEAFEKMKPGVMLINCARGGIVDEEALAAALENGKVAGAALDVFETEPPPAEHPLLQMHNVVATPHLGASTIEAQTNVAVAVARQIIEYLTNNNIVNAVNVPSISGDLLEKLGPYLHLADRMGAMMAQYCSGQLKEVRIDYIGDFHGLDMAPVSTAFLKGLLDSLVPDEVNSINAPMLAKEKGIKVSEAESEATSDYTNLVQVQILTTEKQYEVAGTVIGKADARIVRIEDFRIEIVPEGHLALIHNLDVPGAIGSIGNALGENNLNISRMQVGRESSGENNIILIRTDTPVSEAAAAQIQALPKVRSIKIFEL